MIVAISHPDDPHALRVLEHLADAGHEAVLLDLQSPEAASRDACRRIDKLLRRPE